MNLQSEKVSTQIIPRDRHAYLFSILGILASSIENLSVEIRHLQRSEVREAEEFFSKNKKDHLQCLIKETLFYRRILQV